MIYNTIREVKKKIAESGVSYQGDKFADFETSGRIPKPENYVKMWYGSTRKEMRIYTDDEVDQVVSAYIDCFNERKESMKRGNLSL